MKSGNGKSPPRPQGADLQTFLERYTGPGDSPRSCGSTRTKTGVVSISNMDFPSYTNEFWTARQRQANPLHEISYRACFKPQLPRFFIDLLTAENDVVYDPFSGRGTTLVEAALAGRNIVGNDVNPLSRIICEGRLRPPAMQDLKLRLERIPINSGLRADLDLSMFYEEKTLAEILSLRRYLKERKANGAEDSIDKWIRTVATNRLSGHSKGFFSVYTLPPNQAASAANQIRINRKRRQSPEYRDVKSIILKKSEQLTGSLPPPLPTNLKRAADNAVLLCLDADRTTPIRDQTVDLTVTSPPFLNVVNYSKDNWLRCWFNDLDIEQIAKKITRAHSLERWQRKMQKVFMELDRVTRRGGWIAFETGEIKNAGIKLDEHVVKIGVKTGLTCHAVMINKQTFTKTANIWGIANNRRGTNTNRIALFRKDG